MARKISTQRQLLEAKEDPAAQGHAPRGQFLHIPSQRGAKVSSRATATLTLCQLMARQLVAGIDTAGAWLLFMGAAAADAKYSAEHMHGAKEWREHIAGRLLATAKIDQVVEPQVAKGKFARHRADTGEQQRTPVCLPLHSSCSPCLRHAGDKDRKEGVRVATSFCTPNAVANTGCPSDLQSRVQRASAE